MLDWDAARFGALLLNGDIVAKDARDDRMWFPVAAGWPNPLNGTGICKFGIAWVLNDTAYGNRRVAEHAGVMTGARSWPRIYRADDLSIAVMSNVRDHNPSQMIEDLADTLLGP